MLLQLDTQIRVSVPGASVKFTGPSLLDIYCVSSKGSEERAWGHHGVKF